MVNEKLSTLFQFVAVPAEQNSRQCHLSRALTPFCCYTHPPSLQWIWSRARNFRSRTRFHLLTANYLFWHRYDQSTVTPFPFTVLCSPCRILRKPSKSAGLNWAWPSVTNLTRFFNTAFTSIMKLNVLLLRSVTYVTQHGRKPSLK